MSLTDKALSITGYRVKRSKQDFELAESWVNSQITTTAGKEVKGFATSGEFNRWVATTIREARRRGIS